MMKLQNDNYNLKAEESLPYFLSLLDSTTFTPLKKKLTGSLRHGITSMIKIPKVPPITRPGGIT